MSDNRFRLPTGGLIRRERPIQFTFNGQVFSGFEGDTLASALLANGERLTARSFKYHRPRGITGIGAEEPSSFVELLGDQQSGNQPITTVRLRDGLQGRSVNCWPSAKFDLMAINQWFARLLPASFYYKTFMWPNWHVYEPHIRRVAGLAHAPVADQVQGTYETRHWHCDVLVVGAGAAGLMAALTAGGPARGSCWWMKARSLVARCWGGVSGLMTSPRWTGFTAPRLSSMACRWSPGWQAPPLGLTAKATCSS